MCAPPRVTGRLADQGLISSDGFPLPRSLERLALQRLQTHGRRCDGCGDLFMRLESHRARTPECRKAVSAP